VGTHDTGQVDGCATVIFYLKAVSAGECDSVARLVLLDELVNLLENLLRKHRDCLDKLHHIFYQQINLNHATLSRVWITLWVYPIK